MTGDERDDAIDLLTHNVRTELEIQSGVRELGLSSETIADLALAVVANLTYAFDVKWAPKWVKAGEAHVWREHGVARARCTSCLARSPAKASDDEARAWYVEHQRTEHADASSSRPSGPPQTQR